MLSHYLAWVLCLKAFNVLVVVGQPNKNDTNQCKFLVSNKCELVVEDYLGPKISTSQDQLDEVEVMDVDDYHGLRPVLHGTIVRIASEDKLCNLRMSGSKYPVR